jgi:hypothetical protein
MSIRNLLLAASVLAAGFGGGLAFAQPAPQSGAQPPAHEQRMERHAHEHGNPGRFIEGRLAFLKTELKLTAAQQPLFDRLADEMRAGAKTMADRHEARRQQASAQSPVSVSALEKLEQRQASMKEMVAAQDRYLAALRPLYQSLSAEQKQTADQLFAHHGGGMGKHGMRHH